MALVGLGQTSTTISTAIKQPNAFEPVPYRLESFRRMADGTGRKDILASVRRWSVGWRNLSFAEWTTLKSYWDVASTIWLQDLEGSTWKTIIVDELSSPARPFVGGTRRYDVAITFEWVGNNEPTYTFTIGGSTIGGADVLALNPTYTFTIGSSTIGGLDGLAVS